MFGELSISFFPFLALCFGWIFFLISVIIAIVVIKMSHAWKFFKARFGKYAMIRVKDRSGVSDFVLAKKSGIVEGTLELVKGGHISVDPGSKTVDRGTKVLMYDMFGEFASTIPPEYQAIITELKEKGYAINKFDDYRHLIMLASDEVYAEKFIGLQKTEEEKKAARDLQAKLKKDKVTILPYKQYNINELQHMFPFYMSPVYIDAISTAEANRKLKKAGDQLKVAMGWAIVFIMIVVGGAVAWNILGKADVCEPIVQVVRVGIENASQSGSLVV